MKLPVLILGQPGKLILNSIQNYNKAIVAKKLENFNKNMRHDGELNLPQNKIYSFKVI